MDTAVEQQLTSLRKALKVLSLAALIPAIVYFVTTLSFVSKTHKIANDMLPEGTALPSSPRLAFLISDLLHSNFFYLAPLALAGIGACVWFTIRYKTGHFLYLNLGLCLLLLTLGAVMRSACIKVFATIILEMNSPL